MLITCISLRGEEKPLDGLLLSVPPPPAGKQSDARWGWSVAVSGDYIAVGAPRDDSKGFDSGVVKIFDPSGALVRVLTNPTPEGGDNFGYSVAMHGTRLVVGAYTDRGTFPGEGRAYLYDLAGHEPDVPVRAFTSPEPAFNALFGHSVAIEGNRVAIGSFLSGFGEGRVYIYDLGDPLPNPAVTLPNPDPAPGDEFGSALAMSGTRVVVGAPLDDDNGVQDAGRAYVFDLASATPASPVALLENPNPGAGDAFGRAMAISGSRVAIGARWDDTAEPNAGSAYVFDLAGPSPTTATLVLQATPFSSSGFGAAVALSGDRLLVSATGFLSGRVQLFDLAGETPSVPIATFESPSAGQAFGFALAMDQNRFVVGMPFENIGPVSGGAAFFYDLTPDPQATELIVLRDLGDQPGDLFGARVAVSGSLMVVANRRDHEHPGAVGEVHVFDLASATPAVPFLTLANPIPTRYDDFGYAVAIDGTRVVVGAPGAPVEGTNNAGRAYIYDVAGAAPAQPLHYLQNPAPGGLDGFGRAVGISGTRVLVTCPRLALPEGDGSVYIYDLTAIQPTEPVLTIPAPAAENPDSFGRSASLSGSIAAIGAFGQGANPTATGAVYIYNLDSLSPETPIRTLLDPGLVEHDYFGLAVAVSGKRVLVGAPGGRQNSVQTGRAYLYDLDAEQPGTPLSLNYPQPAAGDQFGLAVALSGRWASVAAVARDKTIPNVGEVFLYDILGADPQNPAATLQNPDPGDSDYFGDALAVEGNTAVVGAPKDDSFVYNKGYVYVFGPRSDPPELIAPAAGSTFAAQVNVSFVLPEPALGGSVKLIFGDGIHSRTLTLAPAEEASGAHAFSFNPRDPSSSPSIATGPVLPDGVYQVTLRYRNISENAEASDTSANVRIDTTAPEIGEIHFDRILLSQGGTFALADYRDDVVVADAGGGVTLTQLPAPGTVLGEGLHQLTFTATDAAGNVSTSTAVLETQITGTSILARDGEEIPNPTGDPRIPPGSTWKRFGIPSIAKSGQRAGWLATIVTPSAGNFRGIFQGELGAPRLRLRLGDDAVDASGTSRPGVSFASFREPVFAGDHFAVAATIRGRGITSANDSGLWFGDAAGLREIAREGARAPGTGSARFQSFTSAVTTSNGAVFFTATLTGTPADNKGLWAWSREGGTRLVLRLGAPQAPGDVVPARAFSALGLVPGSPGHGRYQDLEGAVWALTKLADYTTWHIQAGAAESTIRGGPGEWGSGVMLEHLGLPSPEETGIHWGFVGRVMPDPALAIIPRNNAGIVTENVWARRGSPAPGAPGSVFKSWLNPVTARVPGGHGTAFIASLAGARSDADRGIWKIHGGLELVAREGDEPQDVPGARWRAFASLSVQDLRGPLFTARIASGANRISSSADMGLWATRSDGTVMLLIREGDILGGKVIMRFNALAAVPGSPGQRRAWAAGDGSGRVVYRVFFQDGSSAIVSTAVP